MKKPIVFLLVLLTVLWGGACGTAPDEGEARNVLTDFLQALHAGDYAAAAALYGGDWQVLRDWNPDVPPDDGAALLRQGCEVNGLQCLPLGEVLNSGAVPKGYRFTVTLLAADGAPFETPDGRASFTFSVLRQDGGFSVQDLPPYLP